MPQQIYELVAQGARYWFLFLMVLIVWRSWRWYRKDKRQAKKRLKLLPDAGFVGEMIVLEGSKHLERGKALPVPREGTLGLKRTNDLCVPVAGVHKRHLWFRFEEGKGLLVEPYAKNTLSVDGVPYENRHNPLYMGHGSRLYVGEAVLRLRLFAGFEATGHAIRQSGVEDAPPEQQPDQAQMQQQLQQPEPEEEEILFDDQADVYAYEAAREQGLVDDRAFMRPEGMQKPELPVYDEPAPQPQETFYAPVMDDGWDEQPPTEEDDLTDAAAPPKSAYVGHDEAERAKRQVWDKMFGGGQR